MHSFLRDVALAVRSLRRSRGFVLITVISLGVALGVTTTVFGIVNAALNPVNPVRDPARVVIVTNGGDGAARSAPLTDILNGARRSSTLFEDAAVESPSFSFLRIGNHHDRQVVLQVSSTFFNVTGVQPFLGQSIGDKEGVSGSNDVAMVSFRLWRSALGGRRDLSTASVDVEGKVYRIVGVLPSYMPAGINAGVMVPLPASTLGIARTGLLVARLRPGITAHHAEATLRAVVDPALTAAYGVGRHPFRYLVRSVASDRPEEMSELQRILLVSAFMVLIIACANLGNLMLARGLTRQRDYALCLALGALRVNIIRQTLIEGLVCAMGGAALGIVIAIWAFDLAMYRMIRDVPGLGAMAVSLNWRVFAFGVLAAVVTSLAFAFAPALRTSLVDLSLPLKSGAGTTTVRVRTRFSALIVAEIALTMTLMLGAGLLLKAVRTMRDTQLGYNPRGLLSIDTYFARTPGRRAGISNDEMAALVAAVRRHPAVIDASIEGFAATPRGGPGLVSALAGGGNRRLFAQAYSIVDPQYMRTFGMPIAQGRDFVGGDADARGAVIVNETAARVLWPSESPVGRMLKLGDLETDAAWIPVVGVARDVRTISTVMSATTAGPQVWVVPPRTSAGTFDGVRVRVAPGNESEMRLTLDRIARQVLAPGSIVAVRSALDRFDDAVLARDFLARLFMAFAAVALGLAAVGLYCLLTFTIAERRREFAVRCALGATGGQIVRAVLHDASVMVLAGTGVGAFAAMVLARALDSLLYDVFYTDVVALVVAECVVVVVSFVAVVIPAWRAAKSDPVTVLRAV